MRTLLASALALALTVPLVACGGDGGGGAPDVVDAAPDVAPEVAAEPDVTADPDVPPDVPVGCGEGTVFVPALDDCYPLDGEPGTACAPGDQFVLSFGTNGDFAVDHATVSEWARFPGTVTDVQQDQFEVTGRRQTESGEEDVVARFQWSNFARFVVPISVGQAVQIAWIGAPNPHDPLATRHGLAIRDALGRLLFLVDDGKGDLEDPIWALAPEGPGLDGWTLTREPAGCPVLADPLGRDTPALPMALRVANGAAEALVLPGAEAELDVDGVPHFVRNALAERRVGDATDQPERMAWLIVGRPPTPPGEAGAACSAAEPCADALNCVGWPGGGEVCLP